MRPVLACFPLVTLFLTLALVGLAMLLTGAGPRSAPPAAPDPNGPDAPSRALPWWLFVLVPGAVLVLTALAGWLGPDW